MTAPWRTVRAVAVAIAGGAFGAFVATLLWSRGGEVALAVLICLTLTVVLAVQFETHYRLQHANDERAETLRRLLIQQYDQIEALFSIFALLPLQAPLPALRDWAISPGFAKTLIGCLFAHRPQVVVELGSGASTLVVGYCLKRLGLGRLVSLEHELAFANATRQQVAAHGLEEVVTVIHAPLIAVTIGGRPAMWYNLRHCPGVTAIDLLIVDGPPGHLQREARYPALPLLYPALNADCLVLLDDADRVDEAAILKRWQEEFPDCRPEPIGDPKAGSACLRIKKLTSAALR